MTKDIQNNILLKLIYKKGRKKMKIYEGKLVSEGVKVGIVVARFNEFIT